MDIIKPQDISNMSCRLCLKTTANSNSILNSVRLGLNLRDAIWRLYSIWVTDEMNYPTTICEDCFCELGRSYNFYQKVQAAQEILKAVWPKVSEKASPPKEQTLQVTRDSLRDSSEHSQSEPPRSTSDSSSLIEQSPQVTKGRQTDSSNSRDSSEHSQSEPPRFTSVCSSKSVPSKSEKVSVVKDTIGNTNEKISQENNFVKTNMKAKPHYPIVFVNVEMAVDQESLQNHAAGGNIVENVSVEVHENEDERSSSYEGGDDFSGSESDDDVEGNIQFSDPSSSYPSVEYFAEHYCEDDEVAWNNVKEKIRRLDDMDTFYHYACEICEEHPRFFSFKTLRNHYKNIHKVNGYHTCCKRKIFRQRNLYYHMAHHIKPDIYKCKICTGVRPMRDYLSFQSHLKRKHSDIVSLKCPECSKLCLSQTQLDRHALKHLPEEERKRFVCDTCGKRLKTKCGLQKHIKVIHEGIKEHLCDICAHAFQCPRILEQHKLSQHVGPQNLPCPQCGQKCASYSSLRSHAKKHQEPKFRCTVEGCNSVYHFENLLNHHVRVKHTNEKPFSCEICGKSFKLKAMLKAHQVQHTGETPFQCAFCPRRFASKSNMYSHRKRMHAGELSQLRANGARETATGGDIPVDSSTIHTTQSACKNSKTN